LNLIDQTQQGEFEPAIDCLKRLPHFFVQPSAVFPPRQYV
jgi:hypothetical protein